MANLKTLFRVVGDFAHATAYLASGGVIARLFSKHAEEAQEVSKLLWPIRMYESTFRMQQLFEDMNRTARVTVVSRVEQARMIRERWNPVANLDEIWADVERRCIKRTEGYLNQ